MKNTQIAEVKLTVGNISETYTVLCTSEDPPAVLHIKAKARAVSDFGKQLDLGGIEYKIISRKLLNS